MTGTTDLPSWKLTATPSRESAIDVSVAVLACPAVLMRVEPLHCSLRKVNTHSGKRIDSLLHERFFGLVNPPVLPLVEGFRFPATPGSTTVTDIRHICVQNGASSVDWFEREIEALEPTTRCSERNEDTGLWGGVVRPRTSPERFQQACGGRTCCHHAHPRNRRFPASKFHGVEPL
jgi:hypothetical protein